MGPQAPRVSPTRPQPLAHLFSLPNGWLVGLEDYLQECFERESPPRVSELARLLGVPLSSFVETFHRITGVTPSHYIKLRQIGRAKVLLRTTDLPVGKVAYRAAFGTHKTFHRTFRKHVGMTPKEWRNRR